MKRRSPGSPRPSRDTAGGLSTPVSEAEPPRKVPKPGLAPPRVQKCYSCGLLATGAEASGADVLQRHPLLQVPTCDYCSYKYKQGRFLEQAGHEIFCRWCGDGGELLLCSRCPRAFCSECVSRNFGAHAMARIRQMDDEEPWECFVCDPAPVEDLRLRQGLPAPVEPPRRDLHKPVHPGGRVVSADVSQGREAVRIRMVNSIDSEGVPADLVYITAPVSSTVATVGGRRPNFTVCCDCTDNCRDPSKCACVQAMGGHQPYNSQGRLMDQSLVVFECNEFCQCHQDRCRNRVVSRGIRCKLEVFRTRGRGWGVRCLEDMDAGTFVADYLGEILHETDADHQGMELGDEYLFDLDMWAADCAKQALAKAGLKEAFNDEEEPPSEGARDPEAEAAHQVYDAAFLKSQRSAGLVVDAKRFGNVARFLNHSCEPNLTKQVVFVETQDVRMPRMAFFAAHHIPKLTELTWDYGYRPGRVAGKQQDCLCGAASCRRRMY